MAKKKYSIEEVMDIIRRVLAEYGITADSMLVYYIRKHLN